MRNIMKITTSLANLLFAICVIILGLVEKSAQEIKELSLGDPKLCSDLTKRKVKYESLLVTQGRAGQHLLPWLTSDICKFEVQSVYSKGGVIAVVQKMNLRKNYITGECIDYIQFRTRQRQNSPRLCGNLDARLVMDYNAENVPDFLLPQYFPISYSNSFLDIDGELDVVIYIAKEALNESEKTEFSIVFTSYKDCSLTNHIKHNNIILRDCEKDIDYDRNLEICINKNYFNDGFINCPHFGCLDEGGCLVQPKPDNKISVGNRVIIGSISLLALMFAVFILIIWAFKRHKLFCWAEEFAHPSPSDNNRNSRVIEMNEQTGARLAISQNPQVQPTAPVIDDDKDLPPSYESLFPTTVSSR